MLKTPIIDKAVASMGNTARTETSPGEVVRKVIRTKHVEFVVVVQIHRRV
jgi:DNA repair protein RadC